MFQKLSRNIWYLLRTIWYFCIVLTSYVGRICNYFRKMHMICSPRFFIWSKPINVIVYDILYHRSVDIIDNTFNLMLLALLVYFAMLFCLQGFLIVNVSWWRKFSFYNNIKLPQFLSAMEAKKVIYSRYLFQFLMQITRTRPKGNEFKILKWISQTKNADRKYINVSRSLTGAATRFLLCEYVGSFRFLLIHSVICACTAWSGRFL